MMLKEFLAVLGIFSMISSAAASGNLSNCPLGKTYKVAVVEGGSYIDFQRVFKHMVRALQSQKLIQGDLLPLDYLFDKDDNYQKLVQSSKGGCIEFVADGLYNAHWQNPERQKILNDLTHRILNTDDIDMLWAFGTNAGIDFAKGNLDIPVLVITPSDPEEAGIISKGEFSNRKNVHVQKEIDRYSSELHMFKNIFNFKTLGTLIDDEPENQVAQAFDVIKDFAQKNNIDLKVCKGDITTDNADIAHQEYSRCILELSQANVDAVYLTVSTGANLKGFFKQIKPLIEKKIPTFSQSGIYEVRQGSLMALSEDDMVESGQFEANVVMQILNGKKPEEISQYYNAPLTLAINLKTASLLDWKPPFEILVAVDTVFESIDMGD